MQKTINFDDVNKENINKEHNSNWPQIPDHHLEALDIEKQIHYLI